MFSGIVPTVRGGVVTLRHSLATNQGIIGFVPPAAFNPKTGLLAIEVDVVLTDQQRFAVHVPTRLEDARQRLLEDGGGGLATLRTWIINRAQTRFILQHPELADLIESSDAIFWICGARREPFLR